MKFPSVPLLRCALLCLGMLLSATSAARAQAAASARLSQNTIAVGDAATLTIEISGVQELNPPQSIEVEGLQIRYQGYQQSTQILNGRVKRSVNLTYVVEGQRAGVFVIPAIQIKSDTGILNTEELKLTVRAAAPSTKPPADADGRAQVAFAEIEVDKKSIFLGEAVPVEVRLFVDSKVRWRIEEMPELEGEGFTKVKFPRPREEAARKDGREYSVLTFRTTISPGKAGKIILGPMEVPFIASIPRARKARPQSPLDLFSDDFFSDAFGAFGAMERRKVTAAPIELEVKPLPVAGRPKDFSGAVGQFELAAEGTPNRVKIGDPLTLKMRVSGKGNFDRVNAPTLVDSAGWDVYPPSVALQPKDELAFNGTKAFEMAVVPQAKKSTMPQVQFSYFDPEAGKYVTLRSEAASLTVEGNPIPPVKAPVAEVSGTEPSPEPPRVDQPAVADILGLKYEQGRRVESFEPMYRTPIFWMAQGVPMVGLLAFLGVRLLRKDGAASRLAALRSERARLWRKLRSEAAHAEFYQTAARLVQVETALVTGRPDAGIDAQAARTTGPLDAETLAGIDEIFSARAELLYAGAHHEDGRLPPADRERVLSTLDRFAKAHGTH